MPQPLPGHAHTQPPSRLCAVTSPASPASCLGGRATWGATRALLWIRRAQGDRIQLQGPPALLAPSAWRREQSPPPSRNPTVSPTATTVLPDLAAHQRQTRGQALRCPRSAQTASAPPQALA